MGVRTIGDLASLSHSSVKKLPIKKPRIDTVKDALAPFAVLEDNVRLLELQEDNFVQSTEQVKEDSSAQVFVKSKYAKGTKINERVIKGIFDISETLRKMSQEVPDGITMKDLQTVCWLSMYISNLLSFSVDFRFQPRSQFHVFSAV